MIDVVEKGVESLGPLANTLVQALPLQAAEDAGQQVEGDQTLGVAALAVDRKRDADAPEDGLGLLQAPMQPGGPRLINPALHLRVARADPAL